jgi:hypothetical protein
MARLCLGVARSEELSSSGTRATGAGSAGERTMLVSREDSPTRPRWLADACARRASGSWRCGGGQGLSEIRAPGGLFASGSGADRTGRRRGVRFARTARGGTWAADVGRPGGDHPRSACRSVVQVIAARLGRACGLQTAARACEPAIRPQSRSTRLIDSNVFRDRRAVLERVQLWTSSGRMPRTNAHVAGNGRVFEPHRIEVFAGDRFADGPLGEVAGLPVGGAMMWSGANGTATERTGRAVSTRR